MQLENLRKPLLLSLALGLAAVVGLFIYGDFKGITDSLEDFQWIYLPAILSLTLFNYALRFAKWQYYLRVTDVRNVPWQNSLLIFLAGLAMTLTPAKVGEWLKSYYLKEWYGAPVRRTAPIIIAERLSDGFAMLLLAAGGLVLVKVGWLFLLVAAALSILAASALRYRPFVRWTIGVSRKLPFTRRHTRFIVGFYQSAFVLFSPKRLAIAVAIGFVSWMGEGIALYYVLRGLGADNSFELAVESIFILSITSVAGAILLLPGGLGVAEGGIAGLTTLLTNLSREASATGALLIRICTLWFGVAVGLLALLALTRRGATGGIKKPAVAA